MRNRIAFLSVFIALTLSCKKETQHDYRDEVVGSYSGIRVHSYWAGDSTGWIFHEDTSATLTQVNKSGGDSAIVINFNPAFKTYSFNYRPNREMIQYGTRLILTPDSFYLFSKPNLGPDWNEFYLTR